MDCNNEELTTLSDLIGLIYEVATDHNRWTKDILPAVTEYIQTPSCILFTTMQTPQNGGYFFIHGMTQEHVDLYMNKYHSHDLWAQALLKNKQYYEGNVLIGEDYVPRGQLIESTFYKECLSRDPNMAQVMAGVVFGTDTQYSKPTVCSFFRGLHHPAFDKADARRMRLILPHLSRSLGVMQRLQSAELSLATSLAALDRLPSGVLLLDKFGNVTFANDTARYILDDNDGLCLQNLSNRAGMTI